MRRLRGRGNDSRIWLDSLRALFARSSEVFDMSITDTLIEQIKKLEFRIEQLENKKNYHGAKIGDRQ